ncbi:MAG: HAD family hydrolase [Candidatus Omnitrophica bacterium]|nr:HAD family hydrolase [Candidatus Omnitrophota bacterium]
MITTSFNNIKLVIFDLDGTLIDAYEAIESSFNFTMKKLGLPTKSKSVIKRAVGWGDKKLLSPFVPKKALNSALRIYRAHHRESLPKKSRLFSGVRKLLGRLSSRYHLAVASNRPTRFSKIILKALNINKYFSFLLCGDRLKRGKPHPEILRKILRYFRMQHDEAIYVGDMAIDVQTANSAKIKSIIVTTGSSSLYEIKREAPYQIISNIKQLEKLLIT